MKALGSGAYSVEQEGQLYSFLGARIRAAREQRGLSQVQLADAVGLSRASLSNVENGKQRLLAHNLVAIAQALDMDPGTFLDTEKLPHFTDRLPVPVERLRAMLEITNEEITGLLHALGGVAPETPLREASFRSKEGVHEQGI